MSGPTKLEGKISDMLKTIENLRNERTSFQNFLSTTQGEGMHTCTRAAMSGA